MKRSFCLVAVLVVFGAFATAQAQSDTVDCTGTFFTSKSKVQNKNRLVLSLPGGKRSSFSAFWKDNYMEQHGMAGLNDLDGDGKKELVVYNFTGGAHCCDELYVFRNTAPDRYTQVARLFAGSTCYVDSVFAFDVRETFGYFMTCYACYLRLSAKHKTLQDVGTVNLRYAGGKMKLVPGGEALQQRITQNLAYVKKLGWDGGVKEGGFDDGRRKEMAVNLAVYHFSFGQNLGATRQLFAANYPWKDANAVWSEFTKLLATVKQNMNL